MTKTLLCAAAFLPHESDLLTLGDVETIVPPSCFSNVLCDSRDCPSLGLLSDSNWLEQVTTSFFIVSEEMPDVSAVVKVVAYQFDSAETAQTELNNAATHLQANQLKPESAPDLLDPALQTALAQQAVMSTSWRGQDNEGIYTYVTWAQSATQVLEVMALELTPSEFGPIVLTHLVNAWHNGKFSQLALQTLPA